MPIRTAAIRDRRGIALPMALLALVIVSVLISAALVSSSTELAVSNAQEEAMQSIYTADEGLNRYIGVLDSAFRADPMTLPAEPAAALTLPSGNSANLVRRLMYRRSPVTTPNPTGPPTTVAGTAVYCITATQARTGGRSSRTVGAFVQASLLAGDLALNIRGAGSFGGDVRVSGSGSITGQGTNVSLCGADGYIPSIETSAAGTVDQNGSKITLTDGTRQTTEDTASFRSRILGGKTPLEIAQRATIKFGPLLGSSRVFTRNVKANATVPRDSAWNWGCPSSMGVTCPSPADTSYYPVIGIDAQGGEAEIQGDYGQGILVVVNGALRISGGFKFKGIIIVDGALDITGTVDVRGAVVGFNRITVSNSTGANQNDLSGTMNITFDPCVNQRVQASFNDENPAYQLARPPYGWFEVVR
jgi:type II secretory pathway pseudopilin PulG